MQKSEFSLSSYQWQKNGEANRLILGALNICLNFSLNNWAVSECHFIQNKITKQYCIYRADFLTPGMLLLSESTDV